jgi:hypothetical protein
VQDGVERPTAVRETAHSCRAGALGIEQPPLEDDPHRLAVADDGEVAHAEPCELRDLLGTHAELGVRGLEQHHHHRHVPLLPSGESP